jgi:hypothetical protein
MREEAVVIKFEALSWNLYERTEGNSDQSQGSRFCSCELNGAPQEEKTDALLFYPSQRVKLRWRNHDVYEKVTTTYRGLASSISCSFSPGFNGPNTGYNVWTNFVSYRVPPIKHLPVTYSEHITSFIID